MANFLEFIVAWCLRWPRLVVFGAIALAAAGIYTTVAHFAINTETTRLISSKIQWRQDEIAFAGAFPQLFENIVAVIDAPTPEAADSAADALTKGLQGQAHVERAWRPDANEFLAREGLLLLNTDELKARLGEIVERRTFLASLAADPTLRGLMNALGRQMETAGNGQGNEFDAYIAPLSRFTTTIRDSLAGKPVRLSWVDLFNPKASTPADNRRLVLIGPKLDFTDLQPGRKPIDEVRSVAKSIGINGAGDVRLRLTGQVPLADDEFATVAENYELNVGGTVLAVAIILFLALRSGRIIFAVLSTLFVGLAITSGLGLILVGQFNLISVAFAVLFIGLGVDFGIQFSTRYREERFADDNLPKALVAATRHLGTSLTLAAISLVAGFFCFLPTEFHGVSELGFIAGMGMIIAFVATMTFLPALLSLLKPAPEKRPIETASLVAVDRWIEDHRKLVLALTALVVLAGVPALLRLQFDSNPMDLRSPKVESVSTFLDLAKDPRTAPNIISVLEPNLPAAEAMAAKLAALPEVSQVVSLSTFLPRDQQPKLALIRDAATKLDAVINPKTLPPPNDAATVAAIDRVTGMLKVAQEQGAPDSVNRFMDALLALKAATPQQRATVQTAMLQDFPPLMERLRLALSAKLVTEADIPQEMRADWVAPDGRYRVQATAKGDSNDNAVLAKFAAAVRSIAPHATGAPITVVEAGRTIVRSFLEAGLFAFLAIFAILYFAMRRVSDVALALGPLVLAGIMSLEAAQLLGMSLDFANIIALPLMFGVGVAFHIYYLIAWRKGQTDMLSSSLTRAIFFSSLTTGTAFGSLCLSSHPGTAGMGKLLAISLIFTLIAAFIIVPAFLGPPPVHAEPGEN
jgi:hopanoid biosynthesis associated RND transporter like protein HpnN